MNNKKIYTYWALRETNLVDYPSKNYPAKNHHRM